MAAAFIPEGLESVAEAEERGLSLDAIHGSRVGKFYAWLTDRHNLLAREFAGSPREVAMEAASWFGVAESEISLRRMDET
jgi:hypothetical protein